MQAALYGSGCLVGVGLLCFGASCKSSGTIRQDEVGTMECFGKFSGVKAPGFVVVLSPCMRLTKVSTRVQQYEMKLEVKTKDDVFATMMIDVLVKVIPGKEYQAVYRLQHQGRQIQSFVADIVRGFVPMHDLEDLFQHKSELSLEIKSSLVGIMEDFGWEITTVLVKDVVPDEGIVAAMNDIQACKNEMDAAQAKAEANKLIAVKAAEAEKESKKLQGEGVAASRRAIIRGLKESVCGRGNESNLSVKEVTELLLLTQYWDTMEKLAHGKAKTYFVPSNPNLDQLREAVLQGSGA